MSQQTADEVIHLWPEGPPTVVEGVGPEIEYQGPIGVAGTAVMLRNVSEPTLAVFKPTNSKPNGVGIIVVPGGGWSLLAWEHEGTDVVEWLTAKGYTAFLLKYRVRATPPTQEGYRRRDDGDLFQDRHDPHGEDRLPRHARRSSIRRRSARPARPAPTTVAAPSPSSASAPPNGASIRARSA